MNTIADVGSILGKTNIQTVVEHEALTLPVAAVTELLTVLDDTAIKMMNFVKALMGHIGTQVLTADVARAVRQDRLVLR